jgi:hypothetical protein
VIEGLEFEEEMSYGSESKTVSARLVSAMFAVKESFSSLFCGMFSLLSFILTCMLRHCSVAFILAFAINRRPTIENDISNDFFLHFVKNYIFWIIAFYEKKS